MCENMSTLKKEKKSSQIVFSKIPIPGCGLLND